ncbi:MAG: hypothetical protein D6722_19490, partial [Bacteroidetes bacterium]
HVQSLSVGGINEALRAQGIDQLSGETSITVVHDPSDIRKPYAREMEELESVRDLSGRIIPGYKTFNSVAISGEDKRLHLLGCVPKAYSEADSGESEPGFRAQHRPDPGATGKVSPPGSRKLASRLCHRGAWAPA